MTEAAFFAFAVALAAVRLGVYAARMRRWLEVGICLVAAGLCCFLAVAASTPSIPVWVAIVAAWVVVVLAGLAAWSLIRHLEKQHTGEDTR
ncbi:hypothetical protein [Nonomuraea sp. NPDC005650]|uniref:hypothetical protein n=1 Tax=Nonomuraea sp. NPDC005650 TaxID=3157045 RepID=UPI0033A3C8C8